MLLKSLQRSLWRSAGDYCLWFRWSCERWLKDTFAQNGSLAVKDYQLTKHNLPEILSLLEGELSETQTLLVSTQDPHTGKWGMARLWRAWMSTTARWMAAQGATMPLAITSDGTNYGTRPFGPEDAHQLFTCQWLGVDMDGERLSWSKSGHDDMRAATKGERFIALQRHENWAVERGINLFRPRDSEYQKLHDEQNS